MSDLPPHAIETHYNGYRFRSRLEARWAVFLDELGLEYQYEPEGFELPSGRYLPDFFIPAWEAWLEIKPPDLVDRIVDDGDPEARAAFDRIEQQARELASQTGRRVLVVYGRPWAESHGVLLVDGTADQVPTGTFAACRRCGALGLHVSESPRSARFMALLRRPAPTSCTHDLEPFDGRLGPDGQPANHLAHAFRVASGARFEFGERGRW